MLLIRLIDPDITFQPWRGSGSLTLSGLSMSTCDRLSEACGCVALSNTLLFFFPSLAHSVSHTPFFVSHLLLLHHPSSHSANAVRHLHGSASSLHASLTNPSVQRRMNKRLNKEKVSRHGCWHKSSQQKGVPVSTIASMTAAATLKQINRYVQYQFPPHWTILSQNPNTSGVGAWWWRWNRLSPARHPNSTIHF